MDAETLNAYGVTLKEKLALSTFPVAVRLLKEGEAIPAGLEKPGEQMRHCQFVDTVRRTGRSFITVYDDHQCKGGAAALGLGELSEAVKSGRFYFEKLGHFASHEAAVRTIDSIPFLPAFSSKAVAYAPLEKATFVPDVVLFICTPKQAMLLTQCSLFAEGGRFDASFSGKQSVCSDGVAKVVSAGRPNITIGCSGSRSYAEIKDEEMIFSIPASDLDGLMKGLEVFAK